MADLTDAIACGSFNGKRARPVNGSKCRHNDGGVLYWMSRDQRVHDNWALFYAQQLALKHCVPLLVCFCLVPKFLEATIRQYGFLLKGLQEVEKELRRLHIPFSLELGVARAQVPRLVKDKGISVVVCDFSPLRVPLGWVKETGSELDKLKVPLIQVDAHNIVPCWVASDKAEYAARTIRRKIHSHLQEFLVEIPPIEKHSFNKGLDLKCNSNFNATDESGLRFAEMFEMSKTVCTDWSAANDSLEVDREVAEVSWAEPGYAAGLRMLDEFCKKRLKAYSTQRNDPNMDALSNLSPWYHFGQLSVQRAILTVKKYSRQYPKSVEVYIEEAVVRRELADNYCFYNGLYDSVTGAAQWAQDTLRIHSKDKREYIYTQEQLENGETHDPLWNAAQLQMTREGKMHGFMRMYWAKKILEWTPSPEEALRIAVYLNDRYELDGRDPNGYVGCMWAICGTHDQGWAERAVFGKIRYMNYAGCKRKFDVGQFERRHASNKRKKGGAIEEYMGGKGRGSSSKIMKKEK